MSRLKSAYRTAKLAWNFVMREERKSKATASLGRRLALLRRGFLSQAQDLYNLRDHTLDDYFCDWSKARMSMMYDGRNVRAGYQYGLNNKLFSTAILGQTLRVPAIYAIVEHGRIVPLHPDAASMFGGSWLEACRHAGGRLVVKPSADGRGRGVFMLTDVNGQLHLDGAPAGEQAVADRVRGLNEYIIVEFLRQGDYSRDLYPATTNTIRVVTVIDPDTRVPFIPVCVQRIGRATSMPVDNWNRGGLCAEVDLSTGTLSRAAARETAQHRLVWHDVHPDTGAPIRGARVPGWEALKQEVLASAERMAYFKFLSWDVVVLDKGIAVIEADTVSGIETLQVHRPLLKDERMRRFFEYHGYLRPRRGTAPRAASAQMETVGSHAG